MFCSRRNGLLTSTSATIMHSDAILVVLFLLEAWWSGEALEADYGPTDLLLTSHHSPRPSLTSFVEKPQGPLGRKSHLLLSERCHICLSLISVQADAVRHAVTLLCLQFISYSICRAGERPPHKSSHCLGGPVTLLHCLSDRPIYILVTPHCEASD